MLVSKSMIIYISSEIGCEVEEVSVLEAQIKTNHIVFRCIANGQYEEVRYNLGEDF